MAVDFKFKCSDVETDYLLVESNIKSERILLTGISYGNEVDFVFDLKTAIKFAKTLRTEINKIKE